MFANPQPDLFISWFPENLFFEDLRKKYDDYLKVRDYHMDEMVNFLNSHFQGISMPAFAIQTVEQSQEVPAFLRVMPGSVIPMQTLSDREITLTIKHSNSYLTYFFLLENFLLGFDVKRERPRVNFTVQVSSVTGDKMLEVVFGNCFMVGIDPLELTYDTQLSQFTTFQVRFAFNTMVTNFSIPVYK